MSAATNSGFVYSVGAAVSISLLTAVGTQAIGRLRDEANRRRERYASTVQTLVAWIEFPYRIRRRVDDSGATLAALGEIGHRLQEQLAGDRAWVLSENRRVSATYLEVLGEIKPIVGKAVSAAWNLPPASTPKDMVLGPWGPATLCEVPIQRLEECITYRFGRRRLGAFFGFGCKPERPIPTELLVSTVE